MFSCHRSHFQIDFGKTVLEMTVRHNLHFFKQYSCYLLMFTELCMNKSNHNQFHTRIVTRVTRVSILVKVVCTSYFPCFSKYQHTI